MARSQDPLLAWKGPAIKSQGDKERFYHHYGSMIPSAHDLKSFYQTREGRVVRRVLRARIEELWPDVMGLRVMGCGYATPYLRGFVERSERVFALLHHQDQSEIESWPKGGHEKSLVCSAAPAALPIESESIDRIVLIHSLEHSDNPQDDLAEIWRVLKSNGRLMIIVPNRAGIWAHAEWSPFGQGRPYSVSQLKRTLTDARFTHEHTQEALFMPPLRYGFVMKLAGLFERIGTTIPIAAGVHMIEASKQIYARADKGHHARARVAGSLVPKPILSRKAPHA